MEKAPGYIASMIAAAGIVALAACSGTQGSVPGPSGAAASQGHAVANARSGGLPGFGGPARAPIANRIVGTAHKPADLFVSDSASDAVDVLSNKHWKYVTDITSGISGPDGSFDAGGAFYVANYIGITITEYSSPTHLKYTYSAGMLDPIDVTVDGHGNVYEADYNYPNALAGYVNEYHQGANTVAATCSPGGGVEGVAVDKNGDVFADYNTTPSGNGAITEYRHGLSGCKAKVLPVTLAFAGGMAIDKNGNLLVCDQNSAAIDVIPPPYTSVSKTFGSGFAIPFHITINAKNTQAYVADYSTGEVYVLGYPSGNTIATLGAANGISFAWAAVDSKNFVP